MNKANYLLVCLAEECTEVGKNVAKALRFSIDDAEPGQDLTNGHRITKELIDLYAVVELLVTHGVIEDPKKFKTGMKMKKAKIAKWAEHSRAMGCLEP